MIHQSRIPMRPSVLAILGLGLVAMASGATYVVMKRGAPAAANPPASTAGSEPGRPAESSTSDVAVTLPPDAIKRAGIETALVAAAGAAEAIRVPAVVQPNAYRSATVTSVAGGRIMRVLVELGQHVRRGQTLAEIHSPELAEAQTRLLSARAELDAHERELRRTEKLVEIGAASREELERVHAEHTAATTMVQSLRSRLTLLGMTQAQLVQLSSTAEVASIISIPAPIDGVITVRAANVGVNIDPASPLFTVVDLSTVWLVGELYERDFPHVRVGSRVMATTTAYPELMLEGKVSYIDPELKAETRTAQIRVEVPNPAGTLRLGMYAELLIGQNTAGSGQGRDAVAVPRSALQTVGVRSVVYLADPSQPGRFVERDVVVGQPSGDMIEIVSGVRAGDAVVAKNSFAIRAERERLGLRASAPRPGGLQTARVLVSDKGFEPARVTLHAGFPARLTFTRTSETTCATEVTVPSLNIRKSLPLNQPIDMEFTPEKAGDIEFVCGMDMLRGTIVVQ